MTDRFIEITDLHKSFFLAGNEIKVLRGVNLSVAAGEIASLTGKSGAGKSTFLHLLGTLDAPNKGSIKINGVEVSEMPNKPLARFRNETIGFVFQFHHLLPEFTALENTMMPALIARKPRAEAEAYAKEILDMVGLSLRFHHKPGELSGGEQQRVAVARALVMKPSLLLADEPTGNLDENTSEGIHNLLIKFNREFKLTMIIATHNTHFAARMPRRLIIEEGVIRDL
ncbi:MAG: ABC transporter ATP-binding protein [Myxococcota bacterium]